MQKIMYAVWRRPAEDAEVFARRLRTEVAEDLLGRDVRALQVNVLDDDVRAGSALVPHGLRRVAATPQMEAVISLWVDSAVSVMREEIDRVMLNAGERTAGFAVCESEPRPNRLHPPRIGERTEGFAQLAFIQRPSNMRYEAWLARWHDHHTMVALETQSTFEYRQNLVVERFGTAPPWAAIVEEGFPLEALTSRHAFYDSVGDETRLARNMRRMSESTRTFIDHASGLDVLPTSQYVMRKLPSGDG